MTSTLLPPKLHAFITAPLNRNPIPTDLEDLTNPEAQRRTNWPVFIFSSLIIALIAFWAIVAPDNANSVLGTVVGAVTEHLGWFYILTAAIIIVFMILVALSRSGKVRLGPDDSKPQYSLLSWGSMLFAAGIGIDLLFFSVVEPLSQYYAPPVGKGGTIAAAREAVVLTIFHYGITGWAMYALMGMAFALFAYRYKMPLAIRSALYPLIGKRIHGSAGDAVQIAAVLGTVFGVATSLGIGVVQLNAGLTIVFGIPQGFAAQIALIIIAVATATITAVAGVDKGIKRLCELNVALAGILMVYVLFAGKQATFLLNGLIMNIGQYLVEFPGLSVDTYAFTADRTWMQSWTLFFWAWWVAWAPFVGLFLARISRGRTLRQFVIGTFSVPFLFIATWISIFGNTALKHAMEPAGDKFGKLALSDTPEQSFYELLTSLPLAPIVILVASVVGLLLFATSANSAALVTSNFCSFIPTHDDDGPGWMRIFWAVLIGVLTIATLSIGGIPALQNATIIAGLPFAVVIYAIIFGIWRALRAEQKADEGYDDLLSAPQPALAGVN